MRGYLVQVVGRTDRVGSGWSRPPPDPTVADNVDHDNPADTIPIQGAQT